MQDLLPEQREDLEKEMSILSQFNHKNIVRLIEIYKEPFATYMVLSPCPPSDLLPHPSSRFVNISRVANYSTPFVNKNFIKKMMQEE
jgi:serine/threonine protein kinase